MSAQYHNGHWYGGGQDIDIQSDPQATSLNAGEVPTGDTIESVLNTNLGAFIKVYDVTLSSTGNLAAGDTTTCSKLISDFIDSGYTPICVIPRYSGDNQFCIINSFINTTAGAVAAQVRNVSSSADSGNPQLTVIALKTA